MKKPYDVCEAAEKRLAINRIGRSYGSVTAIAKKVSYIIHVQ